MNFKGKSNKVKHKFGGLTVGEANLVKAFESLFEHSPNDVYKSGGGSTFPNISNKIPSTDTLLTQSSKQLPVTNTNVTAPATVSGTIAEYVSKIPVIGQFGANFINTGNPTTSTNIYKYGGGMSKDLAKKELEDNSKMFGTASSIASMVPGIGGLLGGAIQGIGGLFADDIKDKYDTTPLRSESNIYGNLKLGGYVTKKFKQYNTGSHDSGNDQPIDSEGRPSGKADGGYVQNNENAYDMGNGSYVMSDTLVNPMTGNTFNIDAMKINNKYKNADNIPEEQNAIDANMKRLSIINDKMRITKEAVLKACGGKTKQMYNGGPTDPDPRFTQQVDTNVTPLTTINPDDLLIDPITGSVNATSNPQSFTESNSGLALDTSSENGQTIKLGEDLATTTYNPKAAKQVGEGDFNYNWIAAGLKAVALGKSIDDALTPAEKEKTILPNYYKADRQIYSANADYTQAKQDAVGAANLMSNMNRSASTNFGAFQGRQSMNFANLAQQIGNISTQENNMRSQQALQRGQYETNKAVDTANRRYQNRIDNQMNQANADLADQKLFSELSQIGTTFNEYQYYKDALKNNRELAAMKIKEASAILGAKYENFGFDENFMDQISKGNYDGVDFNQLVKFIGTAEQVKKANKSKG